MIPMRSQRPAQPISASPEIPLVLKIEEQATLAPKHQVPMRLVRNSLGESATTSDAVYRSFSVSVGSNRFQIS